MAENKKWLRRKQRQEELREKLQGAEYIRQLDEIDKLLADDPEMPAPKLNVLKARIDLNMRRLAKLLPDEKYLEVEANVSTHEQALSELE